MGKPVIVRELELGRGIPKICIPLVGHTAPEILKEAQRLPGFSPDLAEWRADFFEDALKPGCTIKMLEGLRGHLGSLPLVFTYRTKKEGGRFDLPAQEYAGLLLEAAGSHFADLFDVELSAPPEVLGRLVSGIHSYGAKVILSSHNFETTPSLCDMLSRLHTMQALGADLVKIAVMPHCASDVLALLSAVETIDREGQTPIIGMAMGGTGLVSRLAGEIFGSAVTFGAAEKASAPGQIDAVELRRILELLHNAL